MALDLKINVGDASSSLAAINANLTTLKTQLDSFKGSSSLETTLQRISQMTGFSKTVSDNVDKLAKALQGLENAGSAANALSSVSKSMERLDGLKIGTVVTNITRLTSALSTLQAPPSLHRFANDLNTIATAATALQGKVGTLKSAINALNSPPGLLKIADDATKAEGSVSKLAGSMKFLGSATSVATGLIAGFGISLGGVGIAQFVTSAWDASRAVTQFNTQLTGVTGSGTMAAAELNYVKTAAINMGLPLKEALKGYQGLMQAFQGKEGGAENAKTIFEGFSTALAALGANSEQSERTFRALTQMVNKGKITAEEFTQQLGDGVIPAMRVMEQATGKSSAEIFKLMEAGELGVNELVKMAETLKLRFGPSLAEALNTPMGAMNQLNSAIDLLKASFGQNMGEAMKAGLQALTRAFIETKTEVNSAGQTITTFTGNLTPFGQAIANIGTVVGTAFGGIASAIGFLGSNWSTVASVLTGVVTYFGLAATSSVTFSGGLGVLATAAGAVVKVLGTWPALIGAAVTVIDMIAQSMGGWTSITNSLIMAFYSLGNALGVISDESYNAAVDRYTERMAALKNGTQQTAAATAALGTATASTASSISYAGSSASSASSGMSSLGSSTKAAADGFASLNAVSPQLEAGLDAVATGGNDLNTMLGFVSSSSTEASFGMNKLDAAGTSLDTHLGSAADRGNRFSGIITKTGDASSKASTGIDKTATSVNSVATSASEASTPMSTVSDKMQGVASSANTASEQASGLAGGISRSASAASGAIGSIDALAEAYGRLAKAASAAKAAQGGGDAGGDAEFGSGAGGGIVGALPRSQTASFSAFANAPSFAGGTANTNNYSATLPGGGIPSILHANEAVVPLTGGGSIPVEGGGGATTTSGGPSPIMMELLTLAQLDYTLQGEIKVELYRIWESIDLFMTVSKEHWTKVDADHLQMINHLGVIRTAMLLENSYSAAMITAIEALPAKMDGVISAIDTMRTSLEASLSSMASAMNSMSSNMSSSSTTSSSSATPSSTSSSATTSASTTTSTTSSANSGAFNQGNPNGNDQGVLRQNGKIIAIQNEDGVWTGKFAQASFATGSPNAWRDVRGLPHYADGTPSTSADGSGGFPAILHPDEAVIPLPDGRTVPVTFTNGMETGGGGSGESKVVINVNMQVDAKDASSFAASKKQMMQELEAELKKTARKIGVVSAEDDPTMRVS
jgi:tape measure domain-containing protein